MAERNAPAAPSASRVLHLASGNRWTGAAAPAFAETAALREAGVDAHYAYVGGYRLEAKIGHYDFAHPIIPKPQNPWSFARAVSAVNRVVSRHGFDVIHAHLTWDHWIARVVAERHGLLLARTYHSRRALRNDPLSRLLAAPTALFFVVNRSHALSPLLRKRGAVFTPPPLDLVQFTTDGPDARAAYGLTASERIIAVIGKLSKGRGFEEALRTFRILRPSVPGCRLMIIGHGEHRPRLESLAAELGVAGSVIWAGYHEDDLAEHYRAADLLLFTARGSDEGHRAVLEALACGVPVASMPIEGVDALLPESMIANASEPEALASLAARRLGEDQGTLRGESARRAAAFGYEAAAARLIAAYEASRFTR